MCFGVHSFCSTYFYLWSSQACCAGQWLVLPVYLRSQGTGVLFALTNLGYGQEGQAHIPPLFWMRRWTESNFSVSDSLSALRRGRWVPWPLRVGLRCGPDKRPASSDTISSLLTRFPTQHPTRRETWPLEPQLGHKRP